MGVSATSLLLRQMETLEASAVIRYSPALSAVPPSVSFPVNSKVDLAMGLGCFFVFDAARAGIDAASAGANANSGINLVRDIEVSPFFLGPVRSHGQTQQCIRGSEMCWPWTKIFIFRFAPMLESNSEVSISPANSQCPKICWDAYPEFRMKLPASANLGGLFWRYGAARGRFLSRGHLLDKAQSVDTPPALINNR
jgi:hypothetical protein